MPYYWICKSKNLEQLNSMLPRNNTWAGLDVFEDAPYIVIAKGNNHWYRETDVAWVERVLRKKEVCSLSMAGFREFKGHLEGCIMEDGQRYIKESV